jgi:hypothetical protein
LSPRPLQRLKPYFKPRRRTPAAATAPAARAPAQPSAQAAGNQQPAAPPPADRAVLEAQREQLAGRFAELQSDLGGLAYEMAIRDHFRLDVVVRRAAELQGVDRELAAVEQRLGLAPAPALSSCPKCGAAVPADSAFCGRCGATQRAAAVAAGPPSGSPTVVAPAQPASPESAPASPAAQPAPAEPAPASPAAQPSPPESAPASPAAQPTPPPAPAPANPPNSGGPR